MTRPDAAQRIMKVDPGHGTEEVLDLVRAKWSVRSPATVSGGVILAQAVEPSGSDSSGWGSS